MVISEIKDNSETRLSKIILLILIFIKFIVLILGLKVIRLLASYFLDPATLDSSINQLNGFQFGYSACSTSGYVVAAILYMYAQNLKDALRVLSSAPTVGSAAMEA